MQTVSFRKGKIYNILALEGSIPWKYGWYCIHIHIHIHNIPFLSGYNGGYTIVLDILILKTHILSLGDQYNISPTKMVFCHFSEIQLCKSHWVNFCGKSHGNEQNCPTNASLETNTSRAHSNLKPTKFANHTKEKKTWFICFEKKNHRNQKSKHEGSFSHGWTSQHTKVEPGNSSSPSGEGKQSAASPVLRRIGWVWK